jgi:transcriptional regulator with XRE-family HTH domain
MPNRNHRELRAKLEARPDHKQLQEEASRQLDREDAAYFHTLGEVRRARALTQVELARKLGLAQASVSKVEGQADLYLSTLRRYIEAMGGYLELRAVFPDAEVIMDFDDLEHIDRDNPEASDLRHAL